MRFETVGIEGAEEALEEDGLTGLLPQLRWRFCARGALYGFRGGATMRHGVHSVGSDAGPDVDDGPALLASCRKRLGDCCNQDFAGRKQAIAG
jgi:hypothetical protein